MKREPEDANSNSNRESESERANDVKGVKMKPSVKEEIFRRFFFSHARTPSAYYDAFVAHSYDDLELLMALDLDEQDLAEIVRDCHMRRIHAKHLFQQIRLLKAHHAHFSQWFTRNFSQLRQSEAIRHALISNGVLTTEILQQQWPQAAGFDCFLRDLGLAPQYAETTALVWDRLPRNLDNPEYVPVCQQEEEGKEE